MWHDFNNKRNNLTNKTMNALKIGNLVHATSSSNHTASDHEQGDAHGMTVVSGTANDHGTHEEHSHSKSLNHFDEQSRLGNAYDHDDHDGGNPFLLSTRVLSMQISNPELYRLPEIYPFAAKIYLKGIDFSINTLVTQLGEYWYENHKFNQNF